MNYPVKIYAKAFSDAVLKGASVNLCVKNLLILVEKNRDQKKLPAILQNVERILGQKTNYRKVLVESARELNSASKKLVKSLLKENDDVQEKINPGIIAGIKITINDELQFDGSLSKKLTKILNT